MECTGVPFMIVGQRTLDCHHGSEGNKKVKEKYKNEKEKRKVSFFYYNCCVQLPMTRLFEFKILLFKSDILVKQFDG